jgi:hypothetical protein
MGVGWPRGEEEEEIQEGEAVVWKGGGVGSGRGVGAVRRGSVPFVRNARDWGLQTAGRARQFAVLAELHDSRPIVSLAAD